MLAAVYQTEQRLQGGVGSRVSIVSVPSQSLHMRAAALQDEVGRLQSELQSAGAATLDCQEMLEELQAFSEQLQQEHASLKDQLQVRTSRFCHTFACALLVSQKRSDMRQQNKNFCQCGTTRSP